MPTAFNIPDEAEINSYLQMLFDGATVAPAQPVDPALPGALIGGYIDDDDKPVAACVCDVELAAFSGSALTMIPPGAAEDSVQEKRLEPAMMDNFAEMMNIFSRFFIKQSTPHLRLDKCAPYAELSDDMKAVIDSATDRIDVTIDIPRYGSGRVSVMAV